MHDKTVPVSRVTQISELKINTIGIFSMDGLIICVMAVAGRDSRFKIILIMPLITQNLTIKVVRNSFPFSITTELYERFTRL